MRSKSKTKIIDLSVILTGYNEGDGLLENLNKVKRILESTRYSWEMILFDDKSKDSTPEVFSDFAKTDKRVRAFFHKRNKGRGGTVIDAIEKARGEIVGYIDTDLELAPVHIPEFVSDIKSGADLAVATRIYTVGATNLIRAVLSKGYVFLVHKLLGIKLKDTEAGFKFFNRKKILPILSKIEDRRWFFDTEIVTRSVWAGLVVSEIPVIYLRKPEKQSSVNLVSDSIDYFKKLWLFSKNLPR